jgi:hypothetical protein
MKRTCSRPVLLTALFALTASAAWAGAAKVQVCHIPPGNPANFHTITISENALQAHLGHGDLAGACFAHCDTLCSDGNACTIDACDASEQCISTHPPVNCDDSSLCTIDSCNPATGCASAPKICLDSDNCTINSCDPLTGACVAPPVVCPTGQACNPSNGACEGGGSGTCVCNEGLPGFLEIASARVDSCFGNGRGDYVEFNTEAGSIIAEESFFGMGYCNVLGEETTILRITEAEGAECVAFLRALAAAAGVTCQP